MIFLPKACEVTKTKCINNQRLLGCSVTSTFPSTILFIINIGPDGQAGMCCGGRWECANSVMGIEREVEAELTAPILGPTPPQTGQLKAISSGRKWAYQHFLITFITLT
ncbi:hypothetical protein DdX_11958 [Ditylenchus destructor]|uniref:Uncharacterized protein n=1 Tax=Ditylenchus destructor TaxID=166010 RepID=A0AAD4R454_9BILA|nr:hypothetical protein DdX_11958 [Ditylenchus destructor]